MNKGESSMAFVVNVNTESCEHALSIAEEISRGPASEAWTRSRWQEVLAGEGYRQMLLHHSWSLTAFLDPLARCACGWQPESDLLDRNPWGIVACAFKLWRGLTDRKATLENSVTHFKTKGRRVAEQEAAKVSKFFELIRPVSARFFVVPGGHSNAYAADRMASDVVVLNPMMFPDESFETGTCRHECCHLASAAIRGKWRPNTALQRFMDALWDEGQATYISKMLSGQAYEPPEEKTSNDLIVNMVRDLLDFQRFKNEERYQELQNKWFSGHGFAYDAGESMCYAIDHYNGRDALLSCIRSGIPEFIRVYNSVCRDAGLPAITGELVREATQTG